MEKATVELVRQLNKDSKALACLTFDDLPSEDEWLSIQYTSAK